MSGDATATSIVGPPRPNNFLSRVWRRLQAWKTRFQMDNRLVGRLIELRGNRVRLHGLRISVDNPLISRGHKSTIAFGIYELGEIDCVKRYLNPDDAVLELGGSIGVVSCLTNRLLARPERHLVVEANPVLVPTLKANAELNGCRFTVIEAAAGSREPSVQFSMPPHFLMGRVDGADGHVVNVPSVRLADLAAKLGRPFVLICDIEGAEIGVVDLEMETLRKSARLIIMEIHEHYTGEENAQMMHALADNGFELLDRVHDVVVLRNQRIEIPRAAV